jgi:predicted acylesterase/phospholipase RssA
MASARTGTAAARCIGVVTVRLALILCLVVGTAACSITTLDTMRNQPLPPQGEPRHTRAAETITVDDLADDLFIGIALSGGGSRAANFSAAVLLELDRLGILGKATALSAVSGSTLPTAYFGLNGRDPHRWNGDELRSQLKKDFELRWFGRWFLPQSIFRYWFTNFNRSDLMKEVLDGNLFQHKTFGDMGSGFPRILINSTTLTEGKRFVFSEERFKALHSRIDTFPVANAVMASSAVPAAFHDMTLRDHSVANVETYEHVVDGGSTDNLGTTTLLAMVKALYSGAKRPRGCFLFVVDSYPYPQYPAHKHKADTRSGIDFILDTNVTAAAADALLMARRTSLLDQLNVDAREINIDPFQINAGHDQIRPDLAPRQDLRVECAVWHLSLQRLLSAGFASEAVKRDDDLWGDVKHIAAVVNSIPTRFKLTGKDPRSDAELPSDTLQEYLFRAANYLIRLDNDRAGTPLLKRVCDWFAERGVRDIACEK